MASNLVEFVQRLNTDPQVVALWDTDPEAAMDQANLSDEEKEILTSGDPERIRIAVAEALGLPPDISTDKPKLIVEVTIKVTIAP